MIPETITARSGAATRGERRVFEALRDHLPEDYLVYYNIPVKGRYPDFIIVGPDLGVISLEVKDWRLDSIAAVTKDGVVVREDSVERTLKNPIQQAREYILEAVDMLKKRSLLSDGKHLCFGWGHGVIFPFLSKKEIETPSLFGPSLSEALGPGIVLSGDDLVSDQLLLQLRRLIPHRVPRLVPMNVLQIDEIRGVLYPEIRIGWGCTDSEIVRVMDREQERLARTLGEGHRLVRGVAGSGKTVMLICRARHLRARYPEWRILVLCYNRVLAGYLRDAIGPDPQLEVLHYHSWCWRELEAAGIPIPERPELGEQLDDYWDRIIPQLLLKAYKEERLRSGMYQAILVDEGQDFADDWYRTLIHALDQSTSSLFIALDSSQTIYKRKVSWRDIGIQIVGRTRVLRVNYRNTRLILSTAYTLIRDLDVSGMVVCEAGGEYVVPEKALRDGPMPEIKRFGFFDSERRHALDWIRTRLEKGVSPGDMLVLGLSRSDMSKLEEWHQDAGIPAQLLGGRVRPGVVRLSTVHSAKGLDAESVLLLSAHQLEKRDEAEGRRLFYIAMTRARTELCISYSGESVLVAQIEKSLLH
ncbi:MAG: 3'-5' exonuclease [Thermodesulfobacteriota bacterium]